MSFSEIRDNLFFVCWGSRLTSLTLVGILEEITVLAYHLCPKDIGQPVGPRNHMISVLLNTLISIIPQQKKHITLNIAACCTNHIILKDVFATLGKKQSSQVKKIVLISKEGAYYRSARRKMDLQQPRLNLYANLSPSLSVRQSLRFHEINIHLLLMALMHTSHFTLQK